MCPSPIDLLLRPSLGNCLGIGFDTLSVIQKGNNSPEQHEVLEMPVTANVYARQYVAIVYCCLWFAS